MAGEIQEGAAFEEVGFLFLAETTPVYGELSSTISNKNFPTYTLYLYQ